MDFQAFVDTVAMPCCVLSVRRSPENTCGEIRIVCANSAYRAAMGPAYHDGMAYDALVPRDNKFEDFCFRAAFLGQRMHAYVETKALNCWTDQTMIPLCAESGEKADTGYCQFIFEFTRAAESDRMASVSAFTAENVLKACIELMGRGDFHTTIGRSLDVVRECCEASGARIMLVDHEKRLAVTFSESLDEEAWPTRAETGDVINYELIRSWEDVLGVSNCILVRDERDMDGLAEQNPAWAESMRHYGVRTLALIPLRQNAMLLGYLYVVNFNTARSVEVKELVELMAFFLGAEISNHLLVHKLDVMSRVDALTGLRNRRAMLEKLQKIYPGMPFGVINLDLNGLKAVNDGEGHDAGDRLLVKAAEALQKMFYQDDIFRTGGDEFIVLSPGITQESFDRKLERLRESMNKNGGPSFAFGGCWSAGDLSVNAAFRCADERMYEDKKAYYALHPERKQR